MSTTQIRARVSAAAVCTCVALLAVACGVERPRGIVLIVVDTLRADHLGLYGYPRDTSSHLDQWSEQGRVFEQALATSSWTLPAFGSILTGRIPASHRAGRRTAENEWKRTRHLEESLATLPQLLSAEGFATGAIVNNPWLKPQLGLNRGFDSYNYARTGNRKLRRADEVVDLSLGWLEAHADQRFLLLVHFFDPHMTYDAPAPVRGRFTATFSAEHSLPVTAPKKIKNRASSVPEREREFIIAAYDEEVAFVDQEIGRLFATLRERSLWDELLIILTSDHGEELFEHDGFEHGHAHFQEVLRVPLIVWGNQISPGRSQEPVSQVDFMPTLLDAMGIPYEKFPLARSLWPHLTLQEGIPARPLMAEGTLYGPERRAILEWPLKLEIEPASGDRRLFNLLTDPEELHDLSESDAASANRLADRLVNIRQAVLSRGELDEAPLDVETLEELRALGYID